MKERRCYKEKTRRIKSKEGRKEGGIKENKEKNKVKGRKEGGIRENKEKKKSKEGGRKVV